MQKLILPLDNAQITAGYKSRTYKNKYGFNHYGMDLIDKYGNRKITSLGSGTVVACGMDGRNPKEKLGNAVVIVYKAVALSRDEKITDLACRMYHLDSISVKVGQKLRVGDEIGYYGNTGVYTSGAHLHIEFDSDVNYPQYAYGIGRNGLVIKKGTVDSTISPSEVMWKGDNQKFFYNERDVRDGWIDRSETEYKKVEDRETVADILKDVKNEISILEKTNKAYFERIINKLNKI